jgi:anaerobic carbon-monoxide dehydrogenase iron sulfur subunit
MVACSLVHEGLVIPRLARIQVRLDALEGEHVIHYCHQCRKAACAESCPQGAIQRVGGTGRWAIDGDLCTGCGTCIEACPFQALVCKAEADKALMCDLCDGRPACVASCPTSALEWKGEEA